MKQGHKVGGLLQNINDVISRIKPIKDELDSTFVIGLLIGFVGQCIGEDSMMNRHNLTDQLKLTSRSLSLFLRAF